MEVLGYMPQENYAGSEYKKYLSKLRSLCEELPPFCGEFFRGIEHETLVRSRYAYGVDLRNFFTLSLIHISEPTRH